jgi:uncharacterized membrane protein YedE/YeeE
MNALGAIIARDLKLAARSGGDVLTLVLFFVMVGAIGVHFTWLRLAPRVQGPSAQTLSLAPHAPITRSLLVGAALFGVGWGMAGYCPGPAIVSLGLGVGEAGAFFVAMLGGMVLYRWFASRVTESLEDVAHE